MDLLMKGIILVGMCGIVCFVGMSYQTVLFMAAALVIFIGGIGSLGEFKNQADFDYIHMQHMGAQSNLEQIEQEKRDSDIESKFQIVMIGIGLILVIIGFNV